MARHSGRGEVKTRRGMEAGNDRRAYDAFYRVGGGEMRGWGREYSDGRRWVFKSSIGFRN
jgi:hypothetical protein